jgi:hypothetical protein
MRMTVGQCCIEADRVEIRYDGSYIQGGTVKGIPVTGRGSQKGLGRQGSLIF